MPERGRKPLFYLRGRKLLFYLRGRKPLFYLFTESSALPAADSLSLCEAEEGFTHEHTKRRAVLTRPTRGAYAEDDRRRTIDHRNLGRNLASSHELRTPPEEERNLQMLPGLFIRLHLHPFVVHVGQKHSCAPHLTAILKG